MFRSCVLELRQRRYPILGTAQFWWRMSSPKLRAPILCRKILSILRERMASNEAAFEALSANLAGLQTQTNQGSCISLPLNENGEPRNPIAKHAMRECMVKLGQHGSEAMDAVPAIAPCPQSFSFRFASMQPVQGRRVIKPVLWRRRRRRRRSVKCR